MPRGEHLTDKNVISKRIQSRADNRKELNNFFIHLTSTLRVCRDNYNVVIMSKRTTDKGNIYFFPEGYFSYPLSIIPLVRQLGVSEEDIKKYIKRIEKIKVTFEDGYLILKLPEDFKADPVDIGVSEDADD